MKRSTFESASRVLSAALVFNLGSLAYRPPEQPTAKKVVCTTVSPKYEIPIGDNSVLIGPEPGKNKQIYMTVANPKTNAADIFQKELRSDAIEREEIIDMSKLTKGHNITVSFQDAAPGITMEFTGVYDRQSTPQGEIYGYVEPKVCKS